MLALMSTKILHQMNTPVEQGNLTEAAVLGIASSWQAGSTEASNDDWSSDYMWTIYLSNRI